MYCPAEVGTAFVVWRVWIDVCIDTTISHNNIMQYAISICFHSYEKYVKMMAKLHKKK